MQRVIAAAKREETPLPEGVDRGDLIYRVCLGSWQVLDARSDGEEIKMRREPPAADWLAIWTRLNKQYRGLEKQPLGRRSETARNSSPQG